MNSSLTVWLEVGNRLAHLWADALWRACWQGGIAIALVWALTRPFLRIAPRIHRWLWSLAYLKMLSAFVWASPIPLSLLPAPSIPTLSIQTNTFLHAVPPSSTELPAIHISESVDSVREAVSLPTRPVVAVSSPSIDRQSLSICALFLLWLSGVGAVAVAMIRARNAADRLQHDAKSVTDAQLLAVCVDLSRNAGLRSTPALLQTDQQVGPLLLNQSRPTILLPRSLLLTDPLRNANFTHEPQLAGRQQLHLILAHEVAHIKHNDLRWNWLPALAYVFFFFHPLVWCANREWQLAQELACDAQALALTGADLADYGDALVRALSGGNGRHSHSLITLGVNDSPSILKRRLLAMQSIRPISSRQCFVIAITLLLVGVPAILPWRVVAQNRPASSGTVTDLNPLVSIHIRNVNLAQALELLGKQANIPCIVSADLAVKIDSQRMVSIDLPEGRFQQALENLLQQQDLRIKYTIENGKYLFTLKSITAHSEFHDDPSMRISMNLPPTPFEHALRLFFNIGQVPYRISPSVTAYLDPALINVNHVSLEEGLTALLKSVPNQKTPLRFSKDQNGYLITSGTENLPPPSKLTAIGLPSYHPEPKIKDLNIDKVTPEAALRAMFRATSVNYVMVLPNTMPAAPVVTYTLQEVPLEQAIVHLLRSVNSDPTLTLFSENPAIYRIGLTDPNHYRSDSSSFHLTVHPLAEDVHLSFRLQNVSCYDAIAALMRDMRIGTILDPALQNTVISITGDNLTLDEAIARLIKAMPMGLQITTGGANGAVSFKSF